jgi:hypothetical protein
MSVKRETSFLVTDLHSAIKRVAISIDGLPQQNHKQHQQTVHHTPDSLTMSDTSASFPQTPIEIHTILSTAKTTFDDDYELGHEIGRGGFSTVFSCRSRVTGIVYAVKMVDLRPLRLRERFNPCKSESIVSRLSRYFRCSHPSHPFPSALFPMCFSTIETRSRHHATTPPPKHHSIRRSVRDQ